MAERNEEVFERVREELVKRPNLPTGVLYEMARRIDPLIGEQSPQHFHTRYVVPVKHEQASAQRRQKRGARKARKQQTTAPQAAAPGRRRTAVEPEPQPIPAAPPIPEAQPQLAQPPAAEPAPVRRRSRTPQPAAQPASAARRRREDGTGERRRVRTLFLEFAREVAAAESRGEMVEVLRRLDHYIDQVVTHQS